MVTLTNAVEEILKDQPYDHAKVHTNISPCMSRREHVRVIHAQPHYCEYAKLDSRAHAHTGVCLHAEYVELCVHRYLHGRIYVKADFWSV